MSITDFTISRHAAARALDMGVTAAEIKECLERPEGVQRSKKYPGRRNFNHGRIICTVAADMAVATIQWRTDELWAADLAEGPPCPGREYRGR
jgi:hypothetical protein